MIRHVLIVLLAIALIGGGKAPLAHTAPQLGPIVASAVPCDMVMPSMPMDKSLTHPVEPDRVKHLCCVTAVALTAQVMDTAPAAPAGVVTYWPATIGGTGLTRQPEFIPLRTS